MEQSISIFASLREIKAITFYDIKYSDNVYLMDKNYSPEKEYTTQETIDIQEAWLKLCDEYFNVTKSSEMRSSMRKNKQKLDMLFSLILIESIIKMLDYFDANKDYLPEGVKENMLKDLNKELSVIHRSLRFNESEDIQDQLEQIKAVLGGLKTRYELSLEKEKRNDKKTDISDFYAKKAVMEDVLGRTLSENVNMLQFIEYEKQVKRKVEAQQKTNKRGK